jgi:serine/threonine protein kinase
VNIELNGIVIKEKYRVQGFIRGGAFGDVFFAKHVQKNYDVAVKFVSDMHTYT